MEEHHPAWEIKNEISDELKDRCIILGVTGSVALYRSFDVARGLIRRGAEIRVVLSRTAANMVSPQLFYWATGNEPIVDVTGKTEHITLARQCDAMLIAPATLATMSKIAHGIAEGSVPLTAISLLGYGKPLLIAPAMHKNMYETLQARETIDKLIKQGVGVLEPVKVGKALKIASPNDIVRWTTARVLRGTDLQGKRILVTAGATREHIDAVRYISNPGSGRMGVEIAAEAAARGARVTLIAGHVEVEIPSFIHKVVRVETTEEMARALAEATEKAEYHAMIAAASPVDFKPREKIYEKVASGKTLTITLEPTPKVVSSYIKRPKLLVVFVAEAYAGEEKLVEKALEKIKKYGADMAIANDVGRPDIGFAAPYNQVIIVYPDGAYSVIPKSRKEIVARIIVDRIRNILHG